jgi:hypothetical protein
MIEDLDATLKELLVQKVPINPTLVEIDFELPGKDWSNSLTKPAINLYLYDVRENHELRSNERYRTRTGDFVNEPPPPARVDFSYIISAWASEVVDEHRLLGRVLGTLLRYPSLPTEVLKGSMQAQPFPLRAWISQPERTPNAWDFWGNLDGRLKAGISFVVTLAIETGDAPDIRIVTERVINLKLGVPAQPGP